MGDGPLVSGRQIGLGEVRLLPLERVVIEWWQLGCPDAREARQWFLYSLDAVAYFLLGYVLCIKLPD